MFLNINQSYEGGHIENDDHDNIYEFDELIVIKQKINEIVSMVHHTIATWKKCCLYTNT